MAEHSMQPMLATFLRGRRNGRPEGATYKKLLFPTVMPSSCTHLSSRPPYDAPLAQSIVEDLV